MNIDFNLMYGVQNFLMFVNTNWTSVVIILCLINTLIIKFRSYIKMSDDEKIEIAKKQIKETMLKLITEAECDYLEWISAGSIKRSQVIEKIFNMYPILSKVTDQESLIQWLDETIDESLKTMREIFEKNKEIEEN